MHQEGVFELFFYNRFEGHVLSHRDCDITQEVSQVCFCRWSLPMSSSSLQSSLINMHLHRIQVMNWFLAHPSSTERVGSTALRCHACPHQVFKAQVEPWEKCAISHKNHFSRGTMGFGHNAAVVSCMGWFNPCCYAWHQSKPRFISPKECWDSWQQHMQAGLCISIWLIRRPLASVAHTMWVVFLALKHFLP